MEQTKIITAKTANFSNHELTMATRIIVKEAEKATKSLLTIALTLNQIDSQRLYADDFKNITEYAKSVFGYAKSTVYNMLGVARRFIGDDNKSIIAHSDADYTVNQLAQMLPITTEQVKELDESGVITPDSSLNEIRDAIKRYTEKPETETTETETTETESDEYVEIERDIAFHEYNTTRALEDMATYLIKNNSEDLAEIIHKIIEQVTKVARKHTDRFFN